MHAVDRACRQIKIDVIEEKSFKKLLELKSSADPIDQRLRAIVQKYQKPVRSASDLVSCFTNPAYYKVKTAEELLALRHLRRWFQLYQNRSLSADAFDTMLNRIAHNRRRAMGVNLPQLTVIGE